jgi:two-component system response regulator AtoC
MPAPTVHESRSGGPPNRDGGGALHLAVMAPNLFETHPLPAGGTISIGRDDSADIRITDEQASHLHARFHIDAGGALAVEDLKSSNGTFLRGERIETGRRLPIQLGEAITIGFTHLMIQRRRPAPPRRRFQGHGAFEDRLEEACARAAGNGAALAVVRLRAENEEPAGAAADLIAGALRPGDMLAQYAPGDYEALLIDTDPERARVIAEDAARRVRTVGLPVRTAVATYPADGRTAEALIGRATALVRGAESDGGGGGGGGKGPVLKSEAMRTLYRLAGRAASGQTAKGLINVLILGETGAGKEVLADWIHEHSPRAGGPLVCINCAAISEPLLESELFGHERGAFTGAMQTKPGLLEAAAGGTVFLDEIGDMPAALQTKLLRTLENREVTRVGGLAARPIDVRFLAATNHDLESAVAAKTFRQDLYFRLNGMSLTIPPLRDRPEEIEALARRFIADAAAAAKQRAPKLSAEALELLTGYAWPGNIRELRNVVERALVLCEGGEITLEHLPLDKLRLPHLAAPRVAAPAATPAVAAAASAIAAAPMPAGLVLRPAEAAERQKIVEVLAACGWNQTKAAKKLGIARGTLIERMKRYGIKRPQDSD